MGEYFEKKKYSYKEGGDIADSNTEMLMSKIRELQHHTSEIQKLVNSNTKVEAWVVAKAERSATDLSDITHYIDGKKSIDENKFADGGRLASVEVIFENPEYNYSTSVNPNATEQEIRKYFVGNMFDMGVYPSENFQKVIDIKYKPNNNYAHGGLTEHGLQIGDKIVDKSNYSQNSIQVMNDGRYAMVDLDKGERIEGIYGKGGGVDAFKKGDKVILKFDIEYRKGNEVVYEVVGFDNDKLILEQPNRGVNSRKVQMRSYVSPNDVVLFKKKANGGSIPNNYRGRTTEDIWNSLTENQRVHFLYDHFDELGVKESELGQIANKEFKDLNDDVQDAFKTHTLMGQYAKGGIMYKDLSQGKPQIVNDSDLQKKNFKVDEVDLYRKGKKSFEGSATIDGSETAVKIFRQFWDEEALSISEHMNVMLLNRANKVIGIYQHSKGGIAGTVLEPEMIVLVAVKSLAKGVILAHNHPSGNLEPSEADKNVSRKIKEALKLVDVTLLDSLIITENSYSSLAEYGYLEKGGIMADGGMINYKKIKRIGEDEKYGFKYIVREEGDNYVIVEDEKIELWENSSPMDRKMYYEDLLPKEEVDNEFKHFADGGVMANGGEIEYRVEYEVFVDDADDPYTDNRTKTFKDLDQAIEFAKRVYASVDYEIIKDGEVVEYGYVDTTNKKLSKFADGGETDDDMGVQFIDYKDKMIMYEPHYKEYYTNDIQFDSLEKAKKYIDDGSKMTPAQINLYRRGAMANGGIMEKGERIGDKGEVKYGDLVVGNDYFQVKRPDLGIEKIKITEKENGRYKYKKDTDNYTDEIVAVKYQGRYTDNEKLYGIFEDKDEAKQMAIKLLI
jgi:DNA repair protein RadC